MRQIGTLPDPDAAQKLADYLLTLKIDTQLLEEGPHWGIWARNEDQVAQARAEFAAFQSNPNDPRYAGAAAAARKLRAEEDEAESQSRRQQIDLREKLDPPERLPRLTLMLMLASAGVSLAADTVFASLAGKEIDPANPLLQSVVIQPFGPGGLGARGLTAVARGEVWRLVTPIFLHFGVLHLLFNMLMLRDLGTAVELRRGALRLAVLVVAIAVPSNVAQYYLGGLHPQQWPPVPSPYFGGMSGVLYGLFGYIWMKSRFAPRLGLEMDPNTIVLMIGWFFLCLTGWIGNVANVAHGIGLFMGVVIGAGPHLLFGARTE